jgi:acetyl-CoA carboxylase biotin carboxyl carrier protein
MDLSYDDVLQILKLVDGSACAELHLEVGDLRLHVVRGGPQPAAGQPSGFAGGDAGVAAGAPAADLRRSRPDAGAIPSATPPGGQDRPAAPGPAAPGPADGRDVSGEVPGAVAVRSPMAGTFYRAPSPDAPPFVEEGREVSAEDTVGIVEVMKLMSPLRAGCAGRVARICVEDAQVVEQGQAIMWIQPRGEP